MLWHLPGKSTLSMELSLLKSVGESARVAVVSPLKFPLAIGGIAVSSRASRCGTWPVITPSPLKDFVALVKSPSRFRNSRAGRRGHIGYDVMNVGSRMKGEGWVLLVAPRVLPWSEMSRGTRSVASVWSGSRNRNYQRWSLALDGLCLQCRSCRSDMDRLSKYGVSKEHFQSLLEQQDFACAICANPLEGQKICIDHDHSCCPGKRCCGKCVRGLLCDDCNHGLGFFRDSVDRMRCAIKYLENPV